MVFQDPFSSLDPSMTVAQCVSEPLRANPDRRAGDLDSQVADVLERVGVGLREAVEDARPLLPEPRRPPGLHHRHRLLESVSNPSGAGVLSVAEAAPR